MTQSLQRKLSNIVKTPQMQNILNWIQNSSTRQTVQEQLIQNRKDLEVLRFLYEQAKRGNISFALRAYYSSFNETINQISKITGYSKEVILQELQFSLSIWYTYKDY